MPAHPLSSPERHPRHGDAPALRHPSRGGRARFEVFYDVWSNIHYGYVGKAAGISRTELQEAAGLAEAGLNDAADVISIDIGIELWERNGLRLIPGDIQEALIAHLGDYEAAQLSQRLTFLELGGNGF